MGGNLDRHLLNTHLWSQTQTLICRAKHVSYRNRIVKRRFLQRSQNEVVGTS